MTTYRHILVPTDGSARALDGARRAIALAKDLDAKVTALFVMPAWEPPYSTLTVAADFEYLLGSQTTQVLAHSKTPVPVCR